MRFKKNKGLCGTIPYCSWNEDTSICSTGGGLEPTDRYQDYCRAMSKGKCKTNNTFCSWDKNNNICESNYEGVAYGHNEYGIDEY